MSLFFPPRRELRSATLTSVFDAMGINSRSSAAMDRRLSPAEAKRSAPVRASLAIIDDAIATAPRDVFVRQGEQSRRQVEPPSVIRQPWPFWDGSAWFSSAVEALLFDGEFFGWWAAVDGGGRPTSVQPIPRSDAAVQVTKGVPTYRFNGEEVPFGRVSHIMRHAPGPDGRCRGILDENSQLIAVSLALESYVAQFFRDGAHPTSTIETDQPLTEDQAKKLKERVMTVLAGNREPLALGMGAKLAPYQTTPSDASTVDLMRVCMQLIAMLFTLPPEAIGADSGSSMTYTNTEGLRLRTQDTGALGIARRIEEHISGRWLTRPKQFRLNFDADLRVDTKTRADVQAVLLRAGIVTQNEMRALEDRAPIKTGDKLNWPPFTVVAPPIDGTGVDPAMTGATPTGDTPTAPTATPSANGRERPHAPATTN